MVDLTDEEQSSEGSNSESNSSTSDSNSDSGSSSEDEEKKRIRAYLASILEEDLKRKTAETIQSTQEEEEVITLPDETELPREAPSTLYSTGKDPI
ncbi:hypothetical protein BYT27DRAFT_6876168 [Phlegmacium glaucopus]|nr:hypothetical protein BYT27DRAFT_6876168 [Phlegmacium glaucopus]